MIVCPKCKEEIDDDSRYCDQCGQQLFYCSSCNRVGVGRRCTYCGGQMVGYEEMQQAAQQRLMESQRSPFINTGLVSVHPAASEPPVPLQKGVPTLTLYNPSLDIRLTGINGAVIGRRQGPYQKMFENNMYVSGVHAQLIYKPDSGWCVIDKHSSNGTKLNQRDLQPDVPMSIKSSDIVTLANVNLQVSVS
jgi:hypothetical protein